MVYQQLVLNLPLETISRNLCVDHSTVHRTLRLFADTNSVNKRPYSEQHHLQRRKLTENDQFLVLEQRPGIYLTELQQELLAATGTDVSIATICRFLQSCGFSRTKIHSVTAQRSEDLRAKYVAEVALYDRNMLVFVDETGSDIRNAMRRFGYTLRGQCCVAKRLLVRGKRVSIIAALTIAGVLYYKFVCGTTKGNIFLQFIEKDLLPQ